MFERDDLSVVIEQTFTEGMADGMSPGDCADMIVAVIRAQLMAGAEAAGLLPSNQVVVRSVVSAGSGEPYVQCSVGDQRWEWSVEDARSHAFGVLTTAEAAAHDAAMLQWMMLDDSLNLTKATAIKALTSLRRFRGDVPPEDR